jgi:hypothetical protein
VVISHLRAVDQGLERCSQLVVSGLRSFAWRDSGHIRPACAGSDGLADFASGRSANFVAATASRPWESVTCPVKGRLSMPGRRRATNEHTPLSSYPKRVYRSIYPEFLSTYELLVLYTYQIIVLSAYEYFEFCIDPPVPF